MIVYVAESRIADGLAEPVSIAPIVSELSVNQTPSEINAVPIDGFLCNVIADVRAQPGGRKRDICHLFTSGVSGERK